MWAKYPCKEAPPRRHLQLLEKLLEVSKAIRALMNRVHQPRTLLVLGHNAGMGTAAGADELVEIPTDACAHPGPRRTPFIYRRVLHIRQLAGHGPCSLPSRRVACVTPLIQGSLEVRDTQCP